MTVYLLRHSLTAGNLHSRYNGSTDDPLCPEGVALARESGAFPAVARVFVTPLRRTQETATLLFPRAVQTVVPDLREMDFGAFEGRNADDMADDPRYRAWVDGGCRGLCPDGEGLDGFCRRVEKAFCALLRQEDGALSLFLVVHGGTIRAILSRYAETPRPFHEWQPLNCRGFCAEAAWEGGQPVLRAVTALERLSF